MKIKDLDIAVMRLIKLNGEGPVKAFVDISIANAIGIVGLQVVDGTNGLFVSYPRESCKDGKWYNIVIPLKREVKDEIEHLVLEAYKAE